MWSFYKLRRFFRRKSNLFAKEDPTPYFISGMSKTWTSGILIDYRTHQSDVPSDFRVFVAKAFPKLPEPADVVFAHL
jgi:hypothetical protein